MSRWSEGTLKGLDIAAVTSGGFGEQGAQAATETLGGPEELQVLTKKIGRVAGKSLAFGMSLYDNPGTSGVKQVAKRVVKEDGEGRC